MNVSITQFRKDLFSLVNRALAGEEVLVEYKGRRFKIVPEGRGGLRLAGITPLDLMSSGSRELDTRALRDEMVRAWEKDWSDL